MLDASPDARAFGIRRGMSLGSAHRLAPEGVFLDSDPSADAASLERALERLSVFSPGVAGETDPNHPAIGRIELQLDGLERLWGPEPVLVRRVVEALEPLLPGPPRAGIAGTRFAALIAAADAAAADAATAEGPSAPGAALHIVPIGTEAAFLAPFPAALLSGDPEVRARLARLGLRRIGQVAEIPRSALVARFGSEGALLHARARGEETEPFRPRRAPERLAFSLPIEPPVEDLEPLRFILHRLVGILADQLAGRGMAAADAHLRLTLDPTFTRRAMAPGGPPIVEYRQRLPEPTAEGAAIERLLFARLERTPPPAPVDRMELELAGVVPAAGQQLSLFTPQATRASRLGWQLARLVLAFGDDRIRRMELVDPEAPLPEARWRWVAVGVGDGVGDGVEPDRVVGDGKGLDR
ncbi:MAG: DNA polymerase Y family protein [Candidatus Limnocylindrales bacterium]